MNIGLLVVSGYARLESGPQQFSRFARVAKPPLEFPFGSAFYGHFQDVLRRAAYYPSGNVAFIRVTATAQSASGTVRASARMLFQGIQLAGKRYRYIPDIRRRGHLAVGRAPSIAREQLRTSRSCAFKFDGGAPHSANGPYLPISVGVWSLL